jgi:hypothetical protein
MWVPTGGHRRVIQQPTDLGVAFLGEFAPAPELAGVTYPNVQAHERHERIGIAEVVTMEGGD